MENISEQTAEVLTEQFSEFNKDIEDMNVLLEELNRNIRQEMARCLVEKFLGYIEKYTNATFITRWYWKRKVRKLSQAIKDASAFLK